MCLRPITVRVESRVFGVSRFIDAPCGHCIECLQRRQNDWKLRIMHESTYWSHVYFFTLTYRNEALPCKLYYLDELSASLRDGVYTDFSAELEDDGLYVCSTAKKYDVQTWFKRMREDLSRKSGKRFECKYFICAEYGPNPRGTRRPHYHGILMCNEPKMDLLPYFNEWRDNYGRIDFREVGVTRDDKSKVANYIAKYCSKGCFESRQEDISYGRCEPAWYVMSKNIGYRWLMDNKEQWLKYVPRSVKVVGDWTFEDVRNYFNSSCDESHVLRAEIEQLLDNYFVYDGVSYRYKIPRYYRERLFLAKKKFINYDTGKTITFKPCLSALERGSFFPSGSKQAYESSYAYYLFSPSITYESKVREDTRYVSTSFLSVAIAYCLYMRFLARDRELFEAVQKENPDRTYIDVFRIVESRKKRAIEVRESLSTSSLRNFYETNMWNHRELDFEDLGSIHFS